MFSKWRSKHAAAKKVDIKAPVSGIIVPLSSVPDEAFAGGSMGKGIAIQPDNGRLVAPFSGTVAHVIKSSHAVILEHESGLQILLHIGIDTVSLKGEGFTSHVSTGDQVKEGQLLIEFDPEKIKGAGYSVVTPVIITNAGDLAGDLTFSSGPVKAGQDTLITAVLL